MRYNRSKYMSEPITTATTTTNTNTAVILCNYLSQRLNDLLCMRVLGSRPQQERYLLSQLTCLLD